MNDQIKEPEEHANESFWQDVSKLAQNIINVIKDTLDLVKGKRKESP
ncbi:hypothetical protein ACFL4H_02180 [Candidatus Neomarinimicrobiota bacterium]